MAERTFNLSRSFGEKLFARFREALDHLGSSDPILVELIKPYARVTIDDLMALLESAFWASLTVEEGRYNTFSVSFGPPNEYSADYIFSEPKDYTNSEISDLAAVLAKGYKSLGVWYSPNGSLEIWGIVQFPSWDIQIIANNPGQLLFSVLGAEKSFKAAISGSWWGIVDKLKVWTALTYLGNVPDGKIRELNIELVDGISKAMRQADAYESIAKKMLQHRHGGTLVIVPEHNEKWRDSLASVRYAGNIYKEVRQSIDDYDFAKSKEKGLFSQNGETWRLQEKSNQSLEFVAQLTAVDGATILGRDLMVYGFGAKLKPLDSTDKPQNVRRSRPFEEEPYEMIATTELGGTRHQSAAQFIYDQKDCVAIVCSQDGVLSALSWDLEHNCVQVVTNLEYAL